MNTANKLRITRIAIGIIILIILSIPFQEIGVDIPSFYLMGHVLVDIRYILSGILFAIASFTSYLENSLLKKEKTIGFNILDDVSNKYLMDGLLILLAYQGFISVVVSIIIVLTDILASSFKTYMMSLNKTLKPTIYSKAKNFFLMFGIVLTLFYNLPFEAWGIYVSEILIYIGTVFAVLSAIIYYYQIKKYFMKNWLANQFFYFSNILVLILTF